MRDESRRSNLVTDLACLSDVPSGDVSATTPREGWLYIAATTEGDAPLTLDGQPIETARYGNALEAMRFVPGGDHTVGVGARLEGLTIRTIPALVFCKYGVDPHLPEYGPFDWEFLSAHILPHVNTVVATDDPVHAPRIREWRRRGGHWIVECSLPALGKESVTADEVLDVWSASLGVTDPETDGIIVDEFVGGPDPK